MSESNQHHPDGTPPGSPGDKELESLSALMDNEADDLEVRRLLKSCADNPALLATWERYHLAQSVLHGNARPVSSTLSARIAAQIASEAVPGKAGYQSEPRQAWQQTLGKFAVAAAVAVVAVVTLQTDFSPAITAPGSTPTLVQDAPQSALPAPDAAIPQTLLATDTTPTTLDPGATQFLRDYLEHIRIDEEEPVITVHIQDSPLFRLVNEIGTQPQR